MATYAIGLGDDLDQGKLISGANAALSSPMRDRMKPADISYAQSIIRTAPQRELSQSELLWLKNFAKWYDAYNPQFWTWWENGGDAETRALQSQSRATAPQTGTQARPKPNSTPKTPQEKAVQTTATNPLLPPNPNPDSNPNGTRKAMLFVGWGLLAVFGYFVYKTVKSK